MKRHFSYSNFWPHENKEVQHVFQESWSLWDFQHHFQIKQIWLNVQDSLSSSEPNTFPNTFSEICVSLGFTPYMTLIAVFWKLYLGELCKSFSLNLKSLDFVFSSKSGITDLISKSLTNSGQSSVEKGARLHFNFGFTEFREKRILGTGNAVLWFLAAWHGSLSCFCFFFFFFFKLVVLLLQAV